MKKFILILSLGLVLGLFTGCTDKETTKLVLDRKGYTNITFTGYDWFGCSKGDLFRTQFKATDPNGNNIKGVGCSGFFSGTMLREY